MNFRLRRIGLISSAKFGFVTGAVTAAPVGVVAALLIRLAVGALRRLLEGWQRATIDAGPVSVPVDMIRLLNLSGALATLRRLDELPLIVIAAVFVLVVVIAGLLAAATTSGWAVAFNTMAALSGGLMVELEPENGGKVIVVRRK